jgi:ATP-dependent helicase HrpB
MQLCEGIRSFRELEARVEAGEWEQQLLTEWPTALEKVAPRSLRLPGGRQTCVQYEAGKTPWIASRLQDFFGLKETPRIANGAVPVVVHLLAPNQRPVQMTSDLAGFWQRLYPQVRKELMRRYPRHAWPESVD